MDDKKKLGEILLEAGVIDKFQLKSALAEQNKWGGRLGNHLVQMGILTEELLVKALSKQLKIPNLDLSQMVITRDVLELVPQELAEKFHLVPVAVKKIANKKTLIVAMSDPTNLDAVDELQFRTGHIIKPAVAGDTAIEMAIRRYYYGEEPAGGGRPSEPIPFDSEHPESAPVTAPEATVPPDEQTWAPEAAEPVAEGEPTEASLADLAPAAEAPEAAPEWQPEVPPAGDHTDTTEPDAEAVPAEAYAAPEGEAFAAPEGEAAPADYVDPNDPNAVWPDPNAEPAPTAVESAWDATPAEAASDASFAAPEEATLPPEAPADAPPDWSPAEPTAAPEEAPAWGAEGSEAGALDGAMEAPLDAQAPPDALEAPLDAPLDLPMEGSVAETAPEDAPSFEAHGYDPSEPGPAEAAVAAMEAVPDSWTAGDAVHTLLGDGAATYEPTVPGEPTYAGETAELSELSAEGSHDLVHHEHTPPEEHTSAGIFSAEGEPMAADGGEPAANGADLEHLPVPGENGSASAGVVPQPEEVSHWEGQHETAADPFALIPIESVEGRVVRELCLLLVEKGLLTPEEIGDRIRAAIEGSTTRQ